MKPFGQKKEKENASASPRQQAQFTEMLLMRLDGFIEEDDKVVGVVGTIYPSRESVEVRMDMNCEKASNEKRRDFNAYAKGFKFSKDFIQMELGAILRLPCIRTGEGTADAEWINLVTRNAIDTQKRFRAGFAAVELYTPEDLKEKRKEIYRELRGKVAADRLNYEVDERMLEVSPKKPRYYGGVKFYDHKKPITGDLDGVSEAVGKYFALPRFEKYTDPATQKEFEREQPGMWVRALNDKGEVLAVLDISPRELYKNHAESAQERTALAKERIGQMAEEFPDAKFNVMTYSKVAISGISLTPADSFYELKMFRRAQSMSYKETEEDGEKYFEDRAMESGCLFADNGMVSSCIVPTGAKNVDVSILNEFGEEMPIAGAPKAQEAAEEKTTAEQVPSDTTEPEQPARRRPRP